MLKIKKLQAGDIFNYSSILSGEPAPLTPTIPETLDYSNKFKSYSQGLLNSINKKKSYLNNPVPGIATPEQTKQNIDLFKGGTSKGSNKLFSNFKINNNLLNLGSSLTTGLLQSLIPQAEDKASAITGQVLNTAGNIVSAINPLIGLGVKGVGTLITSVGPKVKGNTEKELTDSSSSYGGLTRLNSKKFGLFGIGKGKRYANKVNRNEIMRSNSEDVLKTAYANKEASDGSIQNLANRYNLNMSGGWQQNNGVRFGKSGTKISYDLSFAHKVLQSGGKIRSLDELIKFAKESNPRFIQRLSEPPVSINFIDDDGNPAVGTHYLESAGEYVIPRIQEIDGKLQFLSHEDAVNRAIESGNYLKMKPEEAIIFAKEYKKGWPNFFNKFEKGGKVNVIPEGALHARKHNIDSPDLDGKITKKGIPVIIEGENGIEQVAEIERNEVIFNKEVTEKLEAFRDKYKETKDDIDAIEAGKLLVQELLYNTIDNTGLLKEVK